MGERTRSWSPDPPSSSSALGHTSIFPNAYLLATTLHLDTYRVILSSFLSLIPDLLPQQMSMGDCPPTAMFDCAQEIFRQTTEVWIGRALGTAQTIFVSLALLEIVVTGWVYWTGKKGNGVSDLLGQFALKLGLLAFVLGLLSTYHHWLPLVTTTFGDSAIYIGGDEVERLSPTHLVNIGLSIFLGAMQAIGLTADFLTFLAWVPALIILLCFVALGAHLLVTLVESYIVVTGGIFFVGFMAFRGTAPLGEGYFQYIVYVGVKLFFIILIASVAAAIGDDMVRILEEYNNLWLDIFRRLFELDPRGAGEAFTSRLGFLWSITAVSLLLAGLGLFMPGRIAERMSRNMTFNFKTVLQKL